MSEPKHYSQFTLNFNQRSQQNATSEKEQPTLKGRAEVIDTDGTVTKFEVAAWGPKPAENGGHMRYSGTLRMVEQDPLVMARLVNTPADPPTNAPDNFKIEQPNAAASAPASSPRNAGGSTACARRPSCACGSMRSAHGRRRACRDGTPPPCAP
jgi:hypothetical protein